MVEEAEPVYSTVRKIRVRRTVSSVDVSTISSYRSNSVKRIRREFVSMRDITTEANDVRVQVGEYRRLEVSY